MPPHRNGARPTTFGRIAAIVFAALVALVLLLVVCFVFIGLYRMAQYNAWYSVVRAPRALLTELYPHLKTGDLLLFAATTHSPANSILTQTYYSHVGLLLRQGDLVYISEAQPGLELMPDPRGGGAPDLRMRHGATLTPLLTRLKYYTGEYHVLRLARPLDLSREEALKQAAERLASAGYPYPTTPQILLGLVGCGSSSARHCFQHIAHLLDGAGLAPLDLREPLARTGYFQVCREICALSGRALPGGNFYAPPLAMLYDIGTLAPAP